MCWHNTGLAPELGAVFYVSMINCYENGQVQQLFENWVKKQPLSKKDQKAW